MIFVSTPTARQAEVTLEQEEENLDTFNMDLEPVPSKPPTPGRVKITPMERDILALVNGVNAVDDIVRKSPHGEFDTCKGLYTLLTRSLIRQATREEVARAAQRATTDVGRRTTWRVQFPWFAIALMPLLALTVLLAPRNPANPLLGPGPKLPPRILGASSWARMAGIWHSLQARAMLVGSYPDTLVELARERLMSPSDLQDPWKRAYRYVLREQSVLLAGNNAQGAPDSNLLLSQHLGTEGEDASSGPGAALITP
jgi:hypothetical protein